LNGLRLGLNSNTIIDRAETEARLFSSQVGVPQIGNPLSALFNGEQMGFKLTLRTKLNSQP